MKKKTRVFIVDDDQDFATSLSMLLELEGFRVELAFSGEDAVKKFHEQDFDITFMDVRMPGMNGVESFFAIRNIKPNARVVMMTAYSMEQLLTRALEGGALGVLHKPFNLENVMNLLQEVEPDGLILVADDDSDFAESVSTLLSTEGYKVLVANTGEQAVQTMLKEDIDVLLLDQRLPIMSGLDVYLELKKKGRLVPTIVCTGYAAEEEESMCRLRELRVTGCLIKPFEPSELLRVIAQEVNSRGGPP